MRKKKKSYTLLNINLNFRQYYVRVSKQNNFFRCVLMLKNILKFMCQQFVIYHI